MDAATKKARIDEVMNRLPNKTYTPESAQRQRVRKALTKFSGDELDSLCLLLYRDMKAIRALEEIIRNCEPFQSANPTNPNMANRLVCIAKEGLV